MAQDHPTAFDNVATRKTIICELNDTLRGNITQPGHNRIVMTAGVAALIGDVSLFRGFRKRAELLRLVRDFDTFDGDNDPHGEHDFGILPFEDATLYWKIDYYDRALAFGSDDPANPAVTTRVLTILLAEEY